jgi:hypothetical protein
MCTKLVESHTTTDALNTLTLRLKLSMKILGKYALEGKKKKKSLMIPMFSPSVHQGEMRTLEMRSQGRREQMFTLLV